MYRYDLPKQKKKRILGILLDDFGLKSLKNLHISNICCTFAASKVTMTTKLISMETAVRQNPVFNPMQIHLLQMFSLDKEEKGLIELKDVLYNYYSEKMKNRLNELWGNGTLDQARLDEINQMDLHQLY